MARFDYSTVVKLAHRFSDCLIEDIGVDVAHVIVANRDEVDSNVCHSHDFCDANMTMQRAFIDVTGLDPVDHLDDEEFLSLWGSAWDLAKKREFYYAGQKG